VRAFNPWPVAYTLLPAARPGGNNGAQRLRIWSARVVAEAGSAEPGTVLASDASGIDVATGRDALRILTLQPASRNIMSSGDYLNAHALAVGTHLGAAAGA
jgi:methionyl-tRNA formyltransferase